MAWIALAVAAIGAGVAAKGAADNKQAQTVSRSDYENRLGLIKAGATQLLSQYNQVVAQRPGLSWDDFVDERVRALNDPNILAAYDNRKQGDFEVLRSIATIATNDNVDNFKTAFDKLSNGKGQEIINQRNDLVLNDDTAQRMTRAWELRAPEVGAGTVRYDPTGKLIEGQSADKKVFDTAYETVVATNQERQQNLAQLERDRTSAAESQQQKATQFMPFYDSTGYITSMDQQSRLERLGFQSTDESRAFGLYQAFAQASAGITPVQPNYQAGDALISSGSQIATGALASYYKNSKSSASSNPYSGAA